MRIHSSFRDYYDKAIGYDEAAQIHWNRETENVIPIPASFKKMDMFPVPWVHASYVKFMIIGFCGHVYPALFDGNAYWSFDEWASHYYDMHFPNTRRGKQWLQKVMTEQAKIGMSWTFTSAGWNDFTQQLQTQDYLHLFRELDTPIWVYQQNQSQRLKLIKNPRLADYEFFRIRNVYNTYQDIEMFLGNQLAHQNDPESSLTDELRAHYAGHDPRTSFHTTSPGKKLRRRNRKRGT